MVLATALGGLLAAAGCGDNSEVCGAGTSDVDGVCMAGSGGSGGSGGATCGPGTKLDAPSNTCVPDGTVSCTDGTILSPDGNCVIDPNSCQDGTVLVGSDCVDKGRIAIDLEEGAEPNGLGLLGEDSNAGAGQITLTGSDVFVIHGHLTPFRDDDGDGQQDADADTYTIHVDAPTAIRVSIDGVGGAMGGMLAVASVADPNSPLNAYERLAFNTSGDTAIRELFLPAAGDYGFAITDARTLVFGGAYGDASAEYYASISAVSLPAATPITVTGGEGTGSAALPSDQLAVFTVPVGVGFNDITMTGPATLSGALDVLASSAFVTNAEPDPANGIINPDAFIAGLGSAETLTVVVDPEYNTSFDPAAVEVDVAVGAATALSKTGGTVSQPEGANESPFLGADPLTAFNNFFYDVGSDGDTLGMALSFNHPVEAVVVDKDLNILTLFTDGNGETFTKYNGLVRHLAAGRYYILVDDPAGTSTDTISVTSTVAKVTATPLATGTASGTTSNGTFGASLFDYAIDSATHPWVAFSAATSGGANVTVAAYDQGSAFGRFNAVDTSDGVAAEPPDAVSLFQRTGITATPSGGRVDLDDGSDYLLVASSSSAAAYTFTVGNRSFTDLGSASTTAATATAQAIAAGGDFFLVRATPGDIVSVTATPTGAVTKPHLSLTELDADENAIVSVSTGATSTAAVTGSFLASTSWIAVEVSGLSILDNGGTYDLKVQITPERAYGAGATATNVAFTSICQPNGSTDVTTTSPFFGGSDADEGVSDAIDIPAFNFYGATAGKIQISTNGWLTFLPTPVEDADAAFENAPLPVTSPLGFIAPYWTDLDQVEVCETQTANAVTVEWKGFLFDKTSETTKVDFQVKLNTAAGAANGTVTVAYAAAAAQQSLGDVATIGVEDYAGSAATQFSSDTANAIQPDETITFTLQ